MDRISAISTRLKSPDALFRLEKRHGRVFLFRGGDKEGVPVRLAWMRPLSAGRSDLAFLGDDKKEAAWISDVNALDPESARIAVEELDERYLFPKISRVPYTHADFGTRYWTVETGAGPRTFAMRDPHRNVTWLSDDRLVLRDTLGNRYEIESLARLDLQSQKNVERVV